MLSSSKTTVAPHTSLTYGNDLKPLTRGSKSRVSNVHISDLPVTWGNWYRHVNWLNATLVIILPLMGLVVAQWVPLRRPTLMFAAIYYVNTGLGITAGYHRLWSHSSYKATWPLKLYLAAVAAGAVEGSIRWWSRDHRAHHRYTDTDKDPYSVRKGFLYAHVGWLVMKQNPKRTGRTCITDLDEDPLVVWQHRHYLLIAITMSLVFPTIVCGLLFQDWLGGLVYGGILRVGFLQQATFCINSLAHTIGTQPFEDRNSARDHALTAVFTLGEGYHNFHHAFPSDYRNAIKWWQFDPTKWSIATWKFFGLAYDLTEFSSNEIEKGRTQQLQKKLDEKRATIDWGKPLKQLPVVKWADFVADAKNGRAVIAIGGIVHDVDDFINHHPGGKTLVSSAIGKDATAMFNGGMYDHSNAAHNLLATMRVGILESRKDAAGTSTGTKEEIRHTANTGSCVRRRMDRAGCQATKVPQPFTCDTPL